jgi:hypothetical protein
MSDCAVAQELPKVAVLSTGGTIASKQDPSQRRLCARPFGRRARRGLTRLDRNGPVAVELDPPKPLRALRQLRDGEALQRLDERGSRLRQGTQRIGRTHSVWIMSQFGLV